MKTKLAYTVRSTRAPGETRDTIVPVIVERLNPVELETVVENCIDRGLIAGLKTTAAHGIAEGVAAQIAREFTLGRGVQFGQYFYGRPYLSGTVDANGRVTSANRINVRLYKGEAFRLTLDDFSFTFDGAGDAVKIDSIYGDTTDTGGNTYGQLVTGAPVKVNGRNLYAAGDTDRVLFDEVGGGATVEVEGFDTQSADMLSFACPAGLVAGKSYRVTVERTDVNGVTRTSAEKKVVVVAGAPGPETFTITGMDSPMTESPNIKRNNPFTLHGTGFDAFDVGAGDKCEARLHSGEYEWTGMPDGDMTVFDGTKIIVDQTFWSDIGWGEMESGTEIDFRLTIGGESKVFTATVVASE